MYDYFTDDHKRDYLKNRLMALEAEHYGNLVARNSVSSDAEREQSERNLKVIERAIKHLRSELAGLPEPESVEDDAPASAT